jgi:hypothetical protein
VRAILDNCVFATASAEAASRHTDSATECALGAISSYLIHCAGASATEAPNYCSTSFPTLGHELDRAI